MLCQFWQMQRFTGPGTVTYAPQEQQSREKMFAWPYSI